MTCKYRERSTDTLNRIINNISETERNTLFGKVIVITTPAGSPPHYDMFKPVLRKPIVPFNVMMNRDYENKLLKGNTCINLTL